ncbi:protein shisa-5-like [Echeneis naucrates]|uniref:Protein shisa-5 n=1 Tax=Echeneis naucrates TaxID=173247 RepID=A0A665UB11_ECHNA|nr:protein shisa-5-like [Echeneis naucrates]
MASGLTCVSLLALYVLFPCVSAGDKCKSYTDLTSTYHSSQYCYSGFCCGSCYNRYCCHDSFLRLSEDQQEDCEFSYQSSPMPMVLGIGSIIVLVLIFICCCVCPCCCLYKACCKPQPVVATTTHTTVVTNATPQYPQQPTATQPQPYQGAQYPSYQPIPMQPGYGAQSVPQGYGPQPMATTSYPSQPFMPGPPPTYQEATGPAYPPNPMPYSQAAFSPGQPPYPMQPPVQPQPNAPPSHPDFLAQPAFNPDYVPPKTG